LKVGGQPPTGPSSTPTNGGIPAVRNCRAGSSNSFLLAGAGAGGGGSGGGGKVGLPALDVVLAFP